MDGLTYTEVPERVRGKSPLLRQDRVDVLNERVARFGSVQPREPDVDGGREVLGDVEAVHRFVDAPGDSETVRWHLVEAGDGEPVIFLHGLPESWYMWHRQITALAPTHRSIAVDLKGYGQSDKKTGDYRQEGVAEQLLALLDTIDVERFNLVTHDRGTVVADYLAANHPHRVLRYLRGEQHLWHFHPDCAPQEQLFVNPVMNRVMDQPLMVVSAYTNLVTYPISDEDIVRSMQEWMHPQIGWAVPRYFASSSFRKEWIDRRTRLIESWDFPVLVMQGYHDEMQPREFYEGVDRLLPNGEVAMIDAGHFYVFENPEQTTKVIADFLAR